MLIHFQSLSFKEKKFTHSSDIRCLVDTKHLHCKQSVGPGGMFIHVGCSRGPILLTQSKYLYWASKNHSFIFRHIKPFFSNNIFLKSMKVFQSYPKAKMTQFIVNSVICLSNHQ